MPQEQRISDVAVSKATGHEWGHWLRVLDKWGASKKEHKEIAKHLQETHGLSGWWAQTVTVEYEKARGVRKAGQVATGGYQVGVMRTMDLSPDAAWKKIAGGKGLAAWLGEGAPRSLREGQGFTLDDGTRVEVRVVKAGSHVRLFWQPKKWKKRSVIQVRVLERAGDRAAIQFHHEDLPEEKDRERMRAHWKRRLQEMA